MPSAIHAELAEALRRRRAMLLSLAARSEAELAGVTSATEVAAAIAGRRLARLVDRLDADTRRELDAIDSALHRVRAGSYGTCTHCTEPIAVPRLLAVPTARFCTSCADDEARSDVVPAPELAAPRLPTIGAGSRYGVQSASRRPRRGG